ncbi:probable helicase senataxin [Aphidius gifuensis]|uniref:probable helicase senataxin n=1 Tax=Aphidius gifuensis TaxID=684658 RepID=UPI001CDD8186|nr:probable helicase senataxin [Aphidius gifuensis]
MQKSRKIDDWNSEFLYRIFQWNTKWFENEKNVRPENITIPQIIGEDLELIKTSLFYENIESYYKAMKPLMINEFFHTLLKDTEDEEVSDDKNTKFETEPLTFTGRITSHQAKVVENIPGKILYELKVEGDVLADLSDDLPRHGDLLYVDCGSSRIFGYLDDIVKKRSSMHELTCVLTVITGIKNIFHYSEIRCTTVKSIQQNLRVVRALVELPDSPLFSSIIEPNFSGYSMSNGDVSTILPLTFEQKLNDMQLKIVADVVKTVDDPDPKISLIQGPPGTGKSTAIIAMITELIKDKKRKKILLCAPSNKAIDAVLLKLLEAASDLEKKGIPLNIVRVGRIEKMDPKVHRVSLSNLALHHKISHLSVTSNVTLCNLEEDILNNADVIASTLTSSFTTQMENIHGNKLQVPVCIIDEAGQSVEIESLIPLILGVEKLILVGDPQQLPPTIISREAKSYGLDLSLFSRAQKYFTKFSSVNPIQMLNVQYRMIDQISSWPNKYFYGGAIKNAAKVSSLPICSYKLLNHESPQSVTSFSNPNEAKIIIKLLDLLINNLPKNYEQGNSPSISVITPYNDQRKMILNQIKSTIYSKLVSSLEHEYKKLEKYDDDDDNKDKSLNADQSSLSNHLYREKKENLKSKRTVKLKNYALLEEIIEKKLARSEKYIANGYYKVIVEISDDEDDDDDEDNYDNNYPAITDKFRKRGNALKKKQTFFTKDEIIAVKLIINEIDKLKKLNTQWESVRINTVDSFQGQEQDIIIMSCVRSNGIGFVSNPNRLNVSLTRAKHTMILCGNFHTFRRNSMWRDLLNDAEKRRVDADISHYTSTEELKKLIFL